MLPARAQMAESDLLNELDALRIENDVLRRRLGHMEQAVDRIERRTPQTGRRKGSRAQEDAVTELKGLVSEIQTARNEAMTAAVTQEKYEKLQNEYRFLYGLLQKAKTERGSMQRLVNELEGQVKQEEEKVRKLEEMRERDRDSFAQVIETDRDKFEEHLETLREEGWGARGLIGEVLQWLEDYRYEEWMDISLLDKLTRFQEQYG
mmetsp:Transcript_23372/g.73277  ORF Transcript_23372/g.73277 Transcript_23372/m.73277 type:complete len:206 (+) Transcript_23372:202-819(+)